MSKSERLEQVEQIRLLLSAFGSDDEAVEAEPAPPAAPGRSTRGSSSSSSTNISPIGGRKSNRLSISPSTAKSIRQELIDRQLQFLKRVHGSIPVFDDGKPDPGCHYEVVQHRQAVDPVPFADDNRRLQLEQAGTYKPDDPRIEALLEEVREAHWKLTAPRGFAALKGIPELQQLLAYTAADVVQYSVGQEALGSAGQFPVSRPLPPDCELGEVETYSECLSGSNSLIGQLCPALRLCLAAEVATGLLCDSQPAPPNTPEHASALLLFLAAALKQAEQECDIPLKHQQDSAWALNPTMDVLKTLIDFCACPEPLGALQQLYGQLPSVLEASGSTVANLGEPGATLNPVLRALSIGFQLSQPPAASPQQSECQRQQQELGQQQNQRQAEQQPEHAEEQQGQQQVNAAAGSSSSSSSTSSAAASSPAPTADGVYARLLHMFAAKQHGASAAAAATASDGTTTQQRQQQQAAAVAEVVKDIITLVDSYLNEVWPQQQAVEQPPNTSPDSGAAAPAAPAAAAPAPAAPAPAATVAPINASSDAANGVTSTGSAEAINSCAAGSRGRDSNPTSSSSSSSDDGEFGNAAASLSNSDVRRVSSIALLISSVTGGLAFKLLLEALRQVSGELPTQGSSPQGSAAARPQGLAAEGPAGDLAAGPEGLGAKADAAEGLPSPEGASVQLWLQQCGVVQAALLVTEIQALFDTVYEALSVSNRWQWLQQQQEQLQQQQQQPEGNEQQQQQQQQLQPDHNQQLPEQAEAPTEEPCTQCTCPSCTACCTIKASIKQVITQKMLCVVASAQRFVDMVADAQHDAAAAAAAAAEPSCAVESSSGRGGSSGADMPPSSVPPYGTTAALNRPPVQQPRHQGSNVQALEKLVGEPSWWFTHAFQHVGLQQLSPVCLHPAVCLQQQELEQQQLSSAAISAGLSPAAADEVTQWADNLRQHGLAWSAQVGHGFASHWLQQRQTGAAQHTAAAEAAAAGCHAAMDNGLDSSGSSSSDSDSSSSSSSSSTSSSTSTTLDGAAAADATGTAAALEALASSSSGGSAILQLCIQPLLPLLMWQRHWLDKAAQVWLESSASTEERIREQEMSKADRTLEQLQLHLPEQYRAATDWSAAGRKGHAHNATCPHCAAEAAAATTAAAGSCSPSNSACDIQLTSSSGSSGLYGQFPVSWSDPFMMRRLLWDLLGKIKPTAQAWFKKHARMCPHSTSARFWHMVVMSLARHIWIPTGPWGGRSIAQMTLILPLHVRLPRKQSRDFASASQNIIRTTYAHQLNIAFARQAIAQTAALLSLQTLRALDPHAARVQPRPELLYYTPSGFHAAVCKTLMQAAEENSGAQQDFWSLCELPAWHMWWHIGLLAYQLQQQQHCQATQLSQHQSAGSSSCGSSSTSSNSGRFQDLYHDPNARLFAVGFAARCLSTGNQLSRLLCGVPRGLMVSPVVWLCSHSGPRLCGSCNEPWVPEKGYKPPCEACGAAVCTAQICGGCIKKGICSTQSCSTEASSLRAWRVLDLLQPSVCFPAQQQQQQQKQQQQKPGLHPGSTSPLAAVSPCIPLAASTDLSSNLTSMCLEQEGTEVSILVNEPVARFVPLLCSMQHRPSGWGLTGSAAPDSEEAAAVRAALDGLAVKLRVKEMQQMYAFLGRPRPPNGRTWQRQGRQEHRQQQRQRWQVRHQQQMASQIGQRPQMPPPVNLPRLPPRSPLKQQQQQRPQQFGPASSASAAETAAVAADAVAAANCREQYRPYLAGYDDSSDDDWGFAGSDDDSPSGRHDPLYDSVWEDISRDLALVDSTGAGGMSAAAAAGEHLSLGVNRALDPSSSNTPAAPSTPQHQRSQGRHVLPPPIIPPNGGPGSSSSNSTNKAALDSSTSSGSSTGKGAGDGSSWLQGSSIQTPPGLFDVSSPFRDPTACAAPAGPMAGEVQSP